jgi:hypothetical protein
MSLFDALPNELLAKIFEYLTAAQLCTICRVSKTWNMVSNLLCRMISMGNLVYLSSKSQTELLFSSTI